MRYPEPGREPLFVPLSAYLLLATFLGLLLGLQWYVAFGFQKRFLDLTFVTLVTNYIWAACGLLVWEMVQLFRFSRGERIRDGLAFLAVGGLLLAAQHARFYLFGGYGSPERDLDYAASARYFFASESIFYLVIYASLVLILRGWYAHQRMQRMQRRTAELQATLTRVELESLRAHLQPHFFFNALNTISALLREHPDEADRLLDLLGRLMRRTLDMSATHTLAEELESCREYLEIQGMRFRSRLAFTIAADAAAGDVEVPAQLLQPIVENCVTHGVAHSTETTSVGIRAVSDGAQLVITVANSIERPSRHQGFGEGLRGVERRLALLYGPAARLSTAESNGRFTATLELPCRIGALQPDSVAAS
jgi:hypothetical protein